MRASYKHRSKSTLSGKYRPYAIGFKRQSAFSQMHTNEGGKDRYSCDGCKGKLILIDFNERHLATQ